MRISFFLLLVIVSTPLFSQSYFSGYAVKSNGDSSNFLIKELAPGQAAQKCIVKSGSVTFRYTPYDLTSYGFFGGERFETLEVNNQKFFARVLVKGKLSLYQEGATFYISSKNEIIELSDSKNDSNNYINTLNSIIQECNLTANAINYNAKGLSSIVQNYNRCTGEAGETFKKKLPKTALHYSLKVGYSKNTITAISKARYESTSSSNCIPVGIGIEFSLPRLHQKISFTTDFVFEKNQYQFYDESIRLSTVTRRDALIKLSLLKIPIGLKYKLFSKNNTTYLTAGFSPTLFISKNHYIIEEKENGAVITTSTFNGPGSISQSGFWIGIGHTQALYNKVSLIIETKFESLSGSISDLNYTTSGNGVSLTVGIRY